MSAELLRRAAREMREKADAATPGPWQHFPPPNVSAIFQAGPGVEGKVVRGGDLGREDAEHIAAWEPTVALAVADLLEALARAVERSGVGDHPEPMSITERGLAVARAYLREES